jgi:hypothetical protein
MKLILSMALGSLLMFSLATGARAGDDKPAKKPEAAAPAKAGKEVTLTGTFGCAKCSFKEAKACQNVLKVKEGGKEVTYELAKNPVGQAHHEDICHAPGGKPATVKGTVSEEGGKKILTASEIKD